MPGVSARYLFACPAAAAAGSQRGVLDSFTSVDLGKSDTTGAAAGAPVEVEASSIAERFSSVASRKLPQIITPPTTTPRSTMAPLMLAAGQRLHSRHAPVRRVLRRPLAVMCPFGQPRGCSIPRLDATIVALGGAGTLSVGPETKRRDDSFKDFAVLAMSSSQSSFFKQGSAWPRWLPQLAWGRESITRLGVIAIFALLAGCEGEVTMDLATELPADPNIDQVVVSVRGLEFTTSSGGTETLEFNDSQQLDFIDLAPDSGVLRLFTDEQLPEGNYTGVRLLFDEDEIDDAFVTVNGAQFPLNLVDGDYASLSFNVEDNESNSESFTLLLDLRQSLSFDDGDDEYTLTPVMRAVNTDDMSRIEGNVSVTCPVGDSLGEGAVYLFNGRDVTPDDIDGAGVEPFATAPVFTSQAGNSFFYTLRYLPQGDYTLALTCMGNDDDPLTDQDLEFRNVVSVGLDERKTITRDLP